MDGSLSYPFMLALVEVNLNGNWRVLITEVEYSYDLGSVTQAQQILAAGLERDAHVAFAVALVGAIVFA
jgi:hypothetical protein